MGNLGNFQKTLQTCPVGQVERTFSWLRHIQTPQCLNIEGATLCATAFCCFNKVLLEVTQQDRLSH